MPNKAIKRMVFKLPFCHSASLHFMAKGQLKNHRLSRRYIIDSKVDLNMRKRIRPPSYEALKVGRSHEFSILLDAVLFEPEKVPAIVASNPEIVYETCWAGENVLHWLAIENMHEEIRLLRSVGSPIPIFALVHAVEHGHLETIIALLELGAEVIPSDITQALNSKWFPKSKKTKSIIKRYFSQFGYEI